MDLTENPRVTQLADDGFEDLAARFVSFVATRVSPGVASLVFASPLSVRSADLSSIWHPGYRRLRWRQLPILLGAALLMAFMKGIVKLLLFRRVFGMALYGEITDTLLVISSSCGQESAEERYSTSYVQTANKDALCVFGPLADLGRKGQVCHPPAMWSQIVICWGLLAGGVRTAVMMDGSRRSRVVLLLQWVGWVVSLDWRPLLILEESLTRVVTHRRVRRLGCVHEMHAYARIVWRVAAKHRLRSYAIQHAPLSFSKRWYFPDKLECAAGLAVPDVFFVYDNDTIQLLRPYYARTTFLLGCSCRYLDWRDQAGGPPSPGGRHYLFVGGLANYDNTVVFNALRHLLESHASMGPVRLRLHPMAVLSRGQRRLVRWMDKRKVVEVSSGTTLADDLVHAHGVIGMGSSVLLQALLLGKPVIQVVDPKYLPAIEVVQDEGAIQAWWNEVSSDMLRRCRSAVTDPGRVRERLGLDQPLVTYTRLFDDSGITNLSTHSLLPCERVAV